MTQEGQGNMGEDREGLGDRAVLRRWATSELRLLRLNAELFGYCAPSPPTDPEGVRLLLTALRSARADVPAALDEALAAGLPDARELADAMVEVIDRTVDAVISRESFLARWERLKAEKGQA